MAERLFYCGVCQVRLSGPAPARQHYESQKHLKKEEVAKLMSISSASGSKYYCKVCNIACDTEMMLKIHEQSDRHQQVLKMADHLFPDVVQVSRGLEAICLEKKHGFDENAATAHSPVPEVGRTVQPVEEKYYEFFGDRGKCYACQIELTSRKHAEQHLTGQKHQKAVKVALAQKQFYGVTSLPHREHAPSSICSYSSSNHQVTSGQFTGDQSTGHLYSDGAVPERQFPLSGNSSLCLNLKESSIPGSSMSLQKPALSSFCQENVESNQLPSTTSSSYDCYVCNKKMPSLEQLHLHNESAVHLRKAERFRSPQLSIDNTVWLPCHHCGKPLNSVKSLRAHFADAHLMTETQINDFFDEQRRKEVDEQQQPLDLRSGAAGERYVTMAQSVAETIPKCIGGRLLSEVNVAPVGLTKSGFSPNKDSNQGSQLSSSPPRPSFPNVRPAVDSREWSKPERQFPLESGAGILGPCGKQSCMFHCDVCSLCLNSVRQREDHMVGSSHVKKLLNTSNCTPSPRNGKFYCALCDSFMNTQKDYNIHLGGQQHTLKAAKKVPAPERDLGPVSKSLDSNACPGMSYKLTVSSPRSYQMELYTKAMEADTVCFLPTGKSPDCCSMYPHSMDSLAFGPIFKCPDVCTHAAYLHMHIYIHARLPCYSCYSDIFLYQLHLLPISACIEYKLVVLLILEAQLDVDPKYL